VRHHRARGGHRRDHPAVLRNVEQKQAAVADDLADTQKKNGNA
jgi:hypothetical protein